MKARKIASTLLTLAILGGGGYFIYTRYVVEKPAPIEYKTAAVERGRVTSTVTASGTLSPLKTVQVGSQVSGRILELYADFNTQVKSGDLLAKLDPSLLESDKMKSKANLLSAQAAVSVAKAAIETVDVNLTYTTIVSPIDGVVISRDVSVGQTVAASLSAPTLFTIAEDLKQMEVHTNVAESDVGTLQQDMRVNFTVDAYPTERFRGVVQQIRNSPQTVSNVVTYDAVVRVVNDELKLRPGMTASVTFNVEDRRDVILVPNAALRYTPSDPAIAALAPQPKAEGRGEGRKRRDEAPDPAASGDAKAPEGDAKIADAKAPEGDAKATDTKTDTKTDAKATDAKAPAKTDAKATTKAPDAKSATAPEGDAKAADAKAEETRAEGDGEGKRRRRGGGGGGGGSSTPNTERTIWILVDGAPKPIQVQIGVSDGSKTEIVAGELKEGDQVITGQTGGEVAKVDAPAASPFNTSGSKTGGVKGGGGGGGRRGGF